MTADQAAERLVQVAVKEAKAKHGQHIVLMVTAFVVRADGRKYLVQISECEDVREPYHYEE